jgi:hypothetical protein
MPFDGGIGKDSRLILALAEAESLIAAGWCQFSEVVHGAGNTKQFCLTGALDEVAKSSREAAQLVECVAAVIPLRYRWSGVSSRQKIITYNDARFRTHRGVVKLVNRAKRRIVNNG